jgi:hypothetical protein
MSFVMSFVALFVRPDLRFVVRSVVGRAGLPSVEPGGRWAGEGPKQNGRTGQAPLP